MSRVLIVEDEAHLAQGLRFNLEAEGHSVVVAGDGERAIELLLGHEENGRRGGGRHERSKHQEFDAVVRGRCRVACGKEFCPRAHADGPRTPRGRAQGIRLGRRRLSS